MSMRPYTSVPALPTMRRCTCERNCSAPNSTRPRYRPRSEISSSIFFTYVSGPSAGAYLFSSSTNTTTASTPRSPRSRCSRSFDTTGAKTRSWPSGSTLATSTTSTARDSNRPHGRSLAEVQRRLGVGGHLAQTPHDRLDVACTVRVRAQRVQVHAIGIERGEIAHPLERLRPDGEPLVATAVFVLAHAGPVEEAQVRTLHVEAHRGNPPLVGREVLEDGPEQELDRAR